MGCFDWCRAKPARRYKRLIANVYPTHPGGTISNVALQRLTYYATATPGRLHDIGHYLFRRLRHDLTRNHVANVHVTMRVMDQLLQACHTNLSFFVDSLLGMVQCLLENYRIELQILGTNSFVKYASIREEAVQYNRRFDFFVDRFSSMCLCGEPVAEVRNRHVRSLVHSRHCSARQRSVTDRSEPLRCCAASVWPACKASVLSF